MTKAAVFIGGVAAGLAAIGLFRDAATRAQYVPTLEPAVTATTYHAPDPVVYADTFHICPLGDVVVLDLGTNLPSIDGFAGGEHHVGAPVVMSYREAEALSAALAHLHGPDGRVPARHTEAGTAPAR